MLRKGWACNFLPSLRCKLSYNGELLGNIPMWGNLFFVDLKFVRPDLSPSIIAAPIEISAFARVPLSWDLWHAAAQRTGKHTYCLHDVILNVLIATINPPRVVATSHGLQGSQSGPNVAIPMSSSWHQTSAGHGVGYTVNHAAYASEREHWSKLSYVGSLAETISLDISVVHDAATKRKGSRGTSMAVSIQILSMRSLS